MDNNDLLKLIGEMKIRMFNLENAYNKQKKELDEFKLLISEVETKAVELAGADFLNLDSDALDEAFEIVDEPSEEKIDEMPLELPLEEENVSEMPVELSPEETDKTEEVSEMPVELPAEEKTEEVSEMPVELPTEEKPEEVSEMPVELPTEEKPEEVSEMPVELPAEEKPEEVSEMPVELPTEEKTVENPTTDSNEDVANPEPEKKDEEKNEVVDTPLIPVVEEKPEEKAVESSTKESIEKVEEKVDANPAPAEENTETKETIKEEVKEETTIPEPTEKVETVVDASPELPTEPIKPATVEEKKVFKKDYENTDRAILVNSTQARRLRESKDTQKALTEPKKEPKVSQETIEEMMNKIPELYEQGRAAEAQALSDEVSNLTKKLAK